MTALPDQILPPQTAVLVFARTAAAEACAKPELPAGASESACVLLRARTLRTARASGLPVIDWDERRQRGESFGERLTHAVSTAFGAGYRRVVIIGADCPELRPAHLLRAARAVEGGGVAIGRDQRGGAYLIGVAAECFEPERFAALPWETGRLATALLAACGRAGLAKARLPLLRDVNRVADFADVLRRLRGTRSWSRWLRQGPRRLPRRAGTSRPASIEQRGRASRRGPPVAA